MQTFQTRCGNNFKFVEAEETAPTEESEYAGAGEEGERESEEDKKPEQKEADDAKAEAEDS